MAYYNGKIYPDGKFSMGYVAPKRRTKKEELYDRIHAMQYDKHTYYQFSYRGKEEKILTQWHDSNVLYEKLKAEGLSPLGSSLANNSHKPNANRSKRGSKGISAYARNMIKAGAHVLERRFGRKRLGMLTCTMPVASGMRYELWSELVRVFIQEMKRQLIRNGGSGHIIGCVEIQEERYRKYGEIAPHLHLVFESHKGDYKYYLDKIVIRKIWERLLGNVFGEEVREYAEETENSTRIEAIKRSAKNYIGKYMSKGGAIVKEIIEAERGDELPRCWWVCTSILRKFIKKNTIPLYPFIKDAIIARRDLVGDKILKWLKEVVVKYQGNDCTLGYCGEIVGYELPRRVIEQL